VRKEGGSWDRARGAMGEDDEVVCGNTIMLYRFDTWQQDGSEMERGEMVMVAWEVYRR
jgi:hypothetical protein